MIFLDYVFKMIVLDYVKRNEKFSFRPSALFFLLSNCERLCARHRRLSYAVLICLFLKNKSRLKSIDEDFARIWLKIPHLKKNVQQNISENLSQKFFHPEFFFNFLEDEIFISDLTNFFFHCFQLFLR